MTINNVVGKSRQEAYEAELNRIITENEERCRLAGVPIFRKWTDEENMEFAEYMSKDNYKSDPAQRSIDSQMKLNRMISIYRP